MRGFLGLFYLYPYFQFKRRIHLSVFSDLALASLCASFLGTDEDKNRISNMKLFPLLIFPHSLSCDFTSNQLSFLCKSVKENSFSHFTGLPRMTAQPQRKITSRALQKTDKKIPQSAQRDCIHFCFLTYFSCYSAKVWQVITDKL